MFFFKLEINYQCVNITRK